ncbi:hypothetical protein [Pararobbsia silviterrae]|uniref:hypothetical protein n=1 Tax=Pararobbsia silviterrae TaxID=1792498 RepID=UPI003B82E05E
MHGIDDGHDRVDLRVDRRLIGHRSGLQSGFHIVFVRVVGIGTRRYACFGEDHRFRPGRKFDDDRVGIAMRGDLRHRVERVADRELHNTAPGGLCRKRGAQGRFTGAGKAAQRRDTQRRISHRKAGSDRKTARGVAGLDTQSVWYASRNRMDSDDLNARPSRYATFRGSR